MRVVVVGAGVAGLAAAARARAQQPDAEVLVVEGKKRVGGLVRSEQTPEGYLLEHGPDSLMTLKPEGMAAVHTLGLEGELVEGTDAPRTAFLAKQQQLLPLPPGIFAMSMGAASAVMRSPLLSVPARMRVLCEPFVRRKRSPDDESLASFVTRRFGREFLEVLIEPLMAGIHGAPADKLSAQSVLPFLVELEAREGSIARGMLRTSQQKPRNVSSRAPLVSLRGGMERLPAAMAAQLSENITLDAPVRCITRGAHGRFELDFGERGRLRAHAVILAVPAHEAAALCATLDGALAHELSGIEHSDYASLHLGFRTGQVHHPMQGTGFIVPNREGRALSACTWVTRKWPDRAPQGCELLRCFVRAPFGPPEELVERALLDLRELMGIEARPIFQHVVLRRRALPSYTLGHRARVARIAQLEAGHAGFALAGNALHGAGIPDCLASGRRAADRVLEALG